MNLRRKKFIEPRLQGRFLLLMLLAAGTGTLVQTVLFCIGLSSLATDLPHDGLMLRDALPRLLAINAVLALALTMPTFVMLGVASSFRVFGPLYRFRQFLTAVAEGRHPAPCRIRQDDELQDVCELLNRVTEPLRARQGDALRATKDAPDELLRAS